MTVKCISGVDKSSIVFQFSQLGQSISSLSYEYKKSRRTIIRVLEEHGIDPGIRRRVKDTTQIQAPKPQSQPIVPPGVTKTSWYQKAKHWLTKPIVIDFSLS